MISRSSPGRFLWTSASRRANLASISSMVAALEPARCSAEDSSAGLAATASGWAIAASAGGSGRRGFRGSGCGRAVSRSMPAPVAMESELVPSCLEGAVFPELPGAAGVIAIAIIGGGARVPQHPRQSGRIASTSRPWTMAYKGRPGRGGRTPGDDLQRTRWSLRARRGDAGHKPLRAQSETIRGTARGSDLWLRLRHQR